MLALLLASLATPSAEAACESRLERAERATGPALVQAFADLAACDRDTADAAFTRLMQNAGDAGTLEALSLAAIDHGIWKPVWTMVGKISDYGARDEVAAAIGAACTGHPDVVPFLQGAYHALRDIDFAQWDDALVSCPSDELAEWMGRTVADPPTSSYDEKWDALAKTWVARTGPEGLPALLEALEVAGRRGGPFDTILEHTISAVTPEFSVELPSEQRDILAERWSEVARRIPAERARVIADRLAQLGADDHAAALLPVLYPDLRQEDGTFLFAAVAVEAGACGDEQRAVIHYAPLVADGSRYDLHPVAEEALRAVRPRLKKCEPAEGPWPVVVSPSPVPDASAVRAFAEQVEATWTEQGYAVKLRKEGRIGGAS